MELQNLLQSLFEGKRDGLAEFLESGGDANSVDSRWNCSMIFHAIYGGDLDNVKRLIEAGADVNYPAIDPASDILAATPMALAMQCRLMMDDDKYAPIVFLLEEHGAEQEPQHEPEEPKH